MEKAKKNAGRKWSLFLLSAIQELFSYEIRQLQKYSQTLEELLQAEAGRLERRVDGKAAGLSKEEKEELYDFFSEQHLELSETYPSILRESLFISSYSVIESLAFKVCGHVKELKGFELNVKDLRGDGLQQCYIYLTRAASLNSLKDNKHYGQLQFLNTIRNALVHNQGRLKEPEKMKSQLKQWPTIKVDQRGQIKLTKDFNDVTLNCISNFGNDLVQVLSAIAKSEVSA